MNWTLLTIKAQVRDLRGQAQGIKEDVTMYLERYGDVRVISVEMREPPPPEQMKIGGGT